MEDGGEEQCLVCSSRIELPHNCLQDLELLPGSNGCSLLNQQIWSIFVLRKLLEYPSGKCSELMEETYGASNPGVWFGLCSTCIEPVKEAMTIHRQILQLEHDIQYIQLRLRTRLTESLGDQLEKSLLKKKIESDSNHCSGGFVRPRDKIRSYFKPDVRLPLKEEFTGDEELVQEDDDDEGNDSYFHEDDAVLTGDIWDRTERSGRSNEEEDPLYIPDNELRRRSKRNRKEKHTLRMCDDDDNTHLQFDKTNGRLGRTNPNPKKCDITSKQVHSPVDDQPINSIVDKMLSEARKVCVEPVAEESDEFSANLGQDDADDPPDLPKHCEEESDCDWNASNNEDGGEDKTSIEEQEKTSRRAMMCKLCGKCYTHLQSFARHIDAHRRVTEFTCPKCTYPCRSASSLKLHLHHNRCKLKTKSDEKPLTPSSFLKLSEKMLLAKIVSVPKPKDDKRKKGIIQVCPTCKREYTNTCSFAAHMKSHKLYKDTECDRCHYPCSSAEVLASHKERNRCRPLSRRNRERKCRFCGFKADFQFRYINHMRAEHGIEFYPHRKPQRLGQPGKAKGQKAKSSSGIKGKLSKKENDLKPPSERKPRIQRPDVLERFKKVDGTYHCNLCPESFKSRIVFVRHRRAHGLKKYVFKCKICTYPARTYLLFRRHMQRFHQAKPSQVAQETRRHKTVEVTPMTGSPQVVDIEVAGAGDKVNDNNVKGQVVKELESSVADPDWVFKKSDKERCSSEELSSASESDDDDKKKAKKVKISCEKCGRTYTNANYFKQHMTDHERYKEFTCPKCSYPCSGSKVLEFHLDRKLCYKRRAPSRYDCDYCCFTTQRRYKFEAHVSVHKEEERLEKRKSLAESKKKSKGCHICKICNRKFHNDEYYRQHQLKHEKCKETTCPTCSYPCDNARLLQVHMERNLCDFRNSINRKGEKKEYPCENCNFKAQSKSALDLHKEKHVVFDKVQKTDDGRFVCDICQEICDGRRQMGIHKRENHGSLLGLETHKCSLCEKSYSREAKLKDHIKQVHENNCRYYCEVCGYGTNHKVILDKHMAKHKPERNYVCESCSTSYKYPHGLVKHLTLHHPEKLGLEGGKGQKEKQFPCKYCAEQKTYPSKALLNLHLKETHKDLYVHQCDECENSYMSLASLQLHKKINHSGETATCQFCNQTFYNKVYMYSHYKTNACKKKPPGFKFQIPRGK